MFNSLLKMLKTQILSVALIAVLLLSIFILSDVAYKRISILVENTALQQLESTLKNNVKLLRLWTDEKTDELRLIVRDDDVEHRLQSLLKKTKNKHELTAIIENSTEIDFFKHELQNIYQSQGIASLLIINNSGVLVFSTNKVENTIDLSLHEKTMFQQIKHQKSVFIAPYISKHLLPDQNGKLVANTLIILIGLPIYDTKNELLGVFLSQIRASTGFTNLFDYSFYGKTSTSYAFDDNGKVVSQNGGANRAITTVKKLLLKTSLSVEGSHYATKHPDVDIEQKNSDYYANNNHHRHQKHKISLGKMNNYTNSDIYGKWYWAPHLNIGIAVEISKNEVLAPVILLRNLFLAVLILLLGAVILSIEIIRRKQVVDKKINILESKNKSQQINTTLLINALVDAVITIDQHGIILTFNTAAEKIFGYKYHEAIGQNINILVNSAERSAHDGYIRNYLSSGESKIIGIGREVKGQRKNGDIFDIELAINEVKINDEVCFTGICRDISQRKKMEQLLITSRTEAIHANKTKSQFLSNMSHELRTPMNAILGFSQLLALDDSLSEENQESVEQILQSGGHLLLLINDVLDLSQVEAGNFEVLKEDVDIKPLVKDVFSLVQHLAKQQQVKLVDNITEPKLMVEADKLRLKQVLLNLISNAIKYNLPKGTVTLEAQATETGYVQISVLDTGQGIPTDLQNNLFTPFERLGAENSLIEGSGIGLSIAKAYVEKMGGTLTFFSKEHEGSVFIVKIPSIDLHNKQAQM